jgi:hypothetical protein
MSDAKTHGAVRRGQPVNDSAGGRPPPALHAKIMTPAAVVALQRTAGNAAVSRFVQRHRDGEGEELDMEVQAGPRPAGGGPSPTQTIRVQRKEEVFNKGSTKPFNDPVAYLKGDNSEHRVMEDPGSQGILGGPDSTFINALGNATTRDKILDAYTDKYNYWEKQQNTLQDATAAKAATNKRDETGRLLTALARVNNRAEGARFYQQNTLAISSVGLSPKTLHNKGNKTAAGFKLYVFHRDTGYLTVAAAALEGDTTMKRQKADALNGPFNQRGWVRGHDAIDNMKHRFIEHIHVNKKDPAGIDIFNGTKAEGETAEAWDSKGELLKPSGRDKTAVNAVIENQTATDLAQY